MNRLIISVVILLMVVLSACNGNEEEASDNSNQTDSLIPIEVNVLTEDEIEVGEMTLSTRVTHDNDPVNDADEVMFEVWKEGQKKYSDMIEGQLTEDGIYEASYTFETDGVYYVVPHVTARNQHHMPKQKLLVGDIAVQTSNNHEESGEHTHSDEPLTVDFSINDNRLSTEILFEGALLDGANVTFEVWQEGVEDQRFWLTADEVEDGVYQAKFNENTSGKHNVTIHIENEDFHEHIQDTFEF